MKQIEDLTNCQIDRIISILLDREFKGAIIEKSTDNKFIIAEYKRVRSEDERYDFISMNITIDEKFQIFNRWDYISNNSRGTTNEPLYNYQFIAKYLIDEGFDIFCKD
jgi:hypothetical protein